jgi:hypothetical protein
MKTAIISSVSKKYFHLAQELIDSINRFPESKSISICLLDNGLEPEQISAISKKIYSIKKSYPINEIYKNLNPIDYENLFLPEYFPEFDKFIHIDSDAWLNSWYAIEYLKRASDNGKIGICSMGDRKVDRVTRLIWLFRSINLLKSQNYKHAIKKGFSIGVAREVGLRPHLNSGVFSLEKDSKFWCAWRKNFEFCIKNSGKKIYGSDQLSLNITVYIDQLEADFLPHYCNWLPNTENVIFDTIKNKFVEKFTPNHEIGIMHLAGGKVTSHSSYKDKDIRFENILLDVMTTKGEYIKKSFRFQK